MAAPKYRPVCAADAPSVVAASAVPTTATLAATTTPPATAASSTARRCLGIDLAFIRGRPFYGGRASERSAGGVGLGGEDEPPGQGVDLVDAPAGMAFMVVVARCPMRSGANRGQGAERGQVRR